MCICSEAFYEHWILFPTVWHLSRLYQGRTQGKAKCGKKKAHSLHEDCWKSITRHRYIAISQKWLKIIEHWILFPNIWHLSRLSQRRSQGGKNVLKWRTFELTGWITGKRLKTNGYMLRCVWQALNSLSIHVTFTAIVPGAYPGEAKMCLRLSRGSQIPPPAKRVKATTYRRDSPEAAKLCLEETDASSVGDSHPSCYLRT